eukprot:GHVS01038775.1.p3 GENE.GHVS01038775.1~~GHVS01038775.1.p3  ORF type:complete len:100 (+),score=4.48 GHVS01038775.1:493-792(+)
MLYNDKITLTVWCVVDKLCVTHFHEYVDVLLNLRLRVQKTTRKRTRSAQEGQVEPLMKARRVAEVSTHVHNIYTNVTLHVRNMHTYSHNTSTHITNTHS